jgi:hypothetical protein
LLYDLFKAYSEDPDMANPLQEYVRQTIDDLLRRLPPAEKLKGLSPEERLDGLPPAEKLKGLSPEERLEGLSPEQMQAAMEALQRRLGKNGSSQKPT